MTFARLQRWLERTLVAEHVRTAGYDVARKGRLQAIFITAFLALPISFLSLGLATGLVPAPSMIVMTIELGVLAAALAVLRFRGWLAVSGNAFVGIVFIATFVSVEAAGGLSGTAATWFMLAPLMALLLVGVRSGLAWLGMVGVALAALSVAHAHGLVSPGETDPATIVRATTLNVGLSAGVAFGCAFLFEQAKRRMLAEVDSARLELEHALRGSRLVLDHIDEALLVVERDGSIQPQRSAAVTRILGAIEPTDTLWSLVARLDPRRAAWIELGWQDLVEGVMPHELVLDQLPRRVSAGDRVLDVTYSAVSEGAGEPDRVLVIARDITDVVAAERAQEEERELVALLSRRSRDEATFRTMWSELSSIVERLGRSELAPAEVARDLHTLKGNAGILDLTALARLCHDAETRGADHGVPLTPEDRAAITAHVRKLDERFTGLVGRGGDAVTIDRAEYDELLARVSAIAPDHELTRMLRQWSSPRLLPHLSLLADRASSLGRRLGKGDVHVTVGGDEVRVSAATVPFLAALPHVVRNAVDHGIEGPEERLALGKPAAGAVHIGARADDESLVLEVGDDGRGIDWDAVARRAAALGLPTRTREERIDALFTDGVSSRTEVTDVSGRGVGLAAVRAAVNALGGTIEVASETGRGTTFRFRLPRDLATPKAAWSPGASAVAPGVARPGA